MPTKADTKLNSDGQYDFAEHERKLAQRFDDEKEAEAYAASVDTPCRPISQVERLIVW